MIKDATTHRFPFRHLRFYLFVAFLGWPLSGNGLLFLSMELFNKILKTAVDGGASDIHIKVGTPVIFRISRELISIDCPIPTNEWLNNVVDKMTPVHMKKKLDDDREVDFSYNLTGVGRFRTNVFQQRGSWALAMRHVKATVPSF